MRGIFGLAAILVTIGVIAWIWGSITLPQTRTALNVQKQVEPQVNVISGKSADGRIRLDESLSLKITNGAAEVTFVMPTGPAATYYGLKVGDRINEIGPLSVRDMMHSGGEAKDYLTDNYSKQGTITVTRDGQRLTLPQPGGATPPPAPAPAAQPAGASNGNKSGGDPLQGQLDAIQHAGGR
jgi:hypothetical protein